MIDLMNRWAALEPHRCHGPFVRIWGEGERDMKCVDEYGEDTVSGRWDDWCIELAVRIACEARGWSLTVRQYPKTEGASVRNTHATVAIYEGPCRHGDSANSAEATLSAYVQMLEAVAAEAESA